ncbi:MAG: response regulator transcription factor [Nitrosomonadales bacterium]
MIRVLIVDDHAVVRHGLKRMLADSNGIEVRAEASNGVEAIQYLNSEKLDVVLLDISMPGQNGFDTLKQIIEGNSGAKVLMLSMYPEDQYAVRLMKAGASGYLTKDAAPEQFIQAIRNVVAGKKYISPNLAELLLFECSQDFPTPRHKFLSDREYQVLRLLGSARLSRKSLISYQSALKLSVPIECIFLKK